MPTRLIEEKFPIKKISELAIPERSSYKPIYQISKWFARRSSSTFRAIILGALLSPSEDLIREFYSKNTFSNLTLLDPFMGGGTTIIEGLRLGLNCIGIDINPVAWFITKTEAEVINLDEMELWIDNCRNKIERKIKQFYVTKCPICNRDADIIYAHWVKLVPCKDCNSSIPLFKSFIISSDKKATTILCPRCEKVFNHLKPIPSNVRCPKCHFDFPPKLGNRTGRNNCRCPNCGAITNILDYLKSNQKKLSSKLFAIEGYCSHCEKDVDPSPSLKETRFKFIKSVFKEDINLYNCAKEKWKEYSKNNMWPKGRIPLGEATKTLHNHNYKKWSDLFNERQLLSLSIILDYIQTIPDQRYKEMLLAAFINLLNHNNIFTRYSPSGKKVEGIFARHDYHPLSTFAENNVWGTKFGRGTWIKCLKRLKKGKEYNLNPYNYDRGLLKDEIKKKNKIYTGRIDGKLVKNDFNSFLSAANNLLLLCEDAGNIKNYPISVDVIISDPPYADNVNYSELSDFFFVWLRLILKESYTYFEAWETPKFAEAIDSKDRSLNYYEKLIEIFKETKSKLKTDGLLIFTFHHSDEQKWYKLADVITKAGFRVVKTHPIPSEARNVLTIRKKRAIAFDLIIVCRSSSSNIQTDNITLDNFIKILNEQYIMQLRNFDEANIKVQQLDYLAIFFGILLEIDYKYKVVNESEQELTRQELWKTCYELMNLKSQ